MDEDEDDTYEEEFEYQASFEGTCTCPPACPNYEDPDKHSWGSCGGGLALDVDCPCEAGWVE
jgi:hypothetical protein